MSKLNKFCCKLVPCGGDSATNDDANETEAKVSTNRRGWTFRKKSVRHQVLSHSSESEVQSGGHTGGPEAGATVLNSLTVSKTEKTSESQRKDDTTQLESPDVVKINVATTLHTTDDPSADGLYLQESIAIVIQSAVRMHLAKKVLCKLKNVVKLQAAMRGHLVRRQASGTFRCVQAIVKMQRFVRARHSRLLLETSSAQEKLALDPSCPEANNANTSIKKFLANRFGSQLLESKSKAKPIYINCDQAKPESSDWKWLERWMSGSSPDTLQSQKNSDHRETRAKTYSDPQVGTNCPAGVMKERNFPHMVKENIDIYDECDLDVEHCKHIISGKHHNSVIDKDVKDGCLDIRDEATMKMGSISTQVVAQSSSTLPTKFNNNFNGAERNAENSNHTVKTVASGLLDNESKHIIFGSKMSTNPAFHSVESKVEEPTFTDTSGRLGSSAHCDALDKSKLYSGVCVEKFFIADDPRIQMCDSECGTELSITSTLDSPDTSEAECGEFVHEVRPADKESSVKYNIENLDAKAIGSSALDGACRSLHLANVQPDELEEVHRNFTGSVSPANRTEVQQCFEQIASGMHGQVEVARDVENMSHEGNISSNITVTDSHGTPSSQISRTSLRNKSNGNLHSKKHLFQFSQKKSSSNQSQDAAVRNSTDLLLKDPNSAKRKNSFDNEPRVSSRNSLPNYMQTTESARAKAYTNSSPKSDPDVQDKDHQLEKRHSLPFMGRKEGSPQMQQSVLGVQQNMKKTVSHLHQNASS